MLGAELAHVGPCETTTGDIASLQSEFGDSWVLIVAQSCEANAVGTTELGELERLKPELDARDIRVYVLGTSSRVSCEAWTADVYAATGFTVSFPIIIDSDLKIASKLGLSTCARHFLFVKKNRLRLHLTYPTSTGVSTFEILRCFDSLSRADQGLATPVNWIKGRDVFVARDDVSCLRSIDLPSGIDYIRLTPDPLVNNNEPAVS